MEENCPCSSFEIDNIFRLRRGRKGPRGKGARILQHVGLPKYLMCDWDTNFSVCVGGMDDDRPFYVSMAVGDRGEED